MTTFDADKIARLLVEVAEEEILPRFRQLADDDIRHKKGGEIVTVADEATEVALTRRLLDLHPGSLVVGEEAVAADPKVLENLSDDRPVWIIDPIDGTTNFSRGNDNFVVMLALVERGEVRAGWLHSPARGESVAAEHGGGAFEAGKKLQVAAASGLLANQMQGTLHAGQFSTPEMARHIEKRRHLVSQVKSRASAGCEYWRLARGETHFSFFTKLMPWDHAPGTLIHREAGGVQRFIDSRLVYSALRHAGQGLLMAPSEESWKMLREVLFG